MPSDPLSRLVRRCVWVVRTSLLSGCVNVSEAELTRARGRVESVEPLEVVDVSGHDGHVVLERGRSDQDITERSRIGNVQRCGAPSDAFVDDEDPALERRGDAVVEPLTQGRSLVGIGALHQQHAVFELTHRDRGDDELGRLPPFGQPATPGSA